MRLRRLRDSIVEAAARTLFQKGLGSRGSAFSLGMPALAQKNTAVELEKFVSQPDVSGEIVKGEVEGAV